MMKWKTDWLKLFFGFIPSCTPLSSKKYSQYNFECRKCYVNNLLVLVVDVFSILFKWLTLFLAFILISEVCFIDISLYFIRSFIAINDGCDNRGKMDKQISRRNWKNLFSNWYEISSEISFANIASIPFQYIYNNKNTIKPLLITSENPPWHECFHSWWDLLQESIPCPLCACADVSAPNMRTPTPLQPLPPMPW